MRSRPELPCARQNPRNRRALTCPETACVDPTQCAACPSGVVKRPHPVVPREAGAGVPLSASATGPLHRVLPAGDDRGIACRLHDEAVWAGALPLRAPVSWAFCGTPSRHTHLRALLGRRTNAPAARAAEDSASTQPNLRERPFNQIEQPLPVTDPADSRKTAAIDQQTPPDRQMAGSSTHGAQQVPERRHRRQRVGHKDEGRQHHITS